MTTPQDILAQVPLFSTLSKKDLAKLADQAHAQDFPAGRDITDEGRTGITFGVIADGQATVSVHGDETRVLSPGDYFGEMALIDHSHRSAKITARTDLRCLMFAGWEFRPFAMEHPGVAWALLEMMVERVREAENR